MATIDVGFYKDDPIPQIRANNASDTHAWVSIEHNRVCVIFHTDSLEKAKVLESALFEFWNAKPHPVPESEVPHDGVAIMGAEVSEVDLGSYFDEQKDPTADYANSPDTESSDPLGR